MKIYKFMRVIFLILFSFIIVDGFSQTYQFQVGGNYTSGNLVSYGLNIRGSILSKSESNQFNFSPSYDYGGLINRVGDFQLVRKEFISVFNYSKSHGRFKFYIYNEIENSLLRQIRIRGSLGLGASIKLIGTDRVNFDISQFILPEVFRSSFNNLRNNKALRLSTRIRYSNSWDRNKINSQLLYQPAVYTWMDTGNPIGISDNTNLRFLISYEFMLSKNLSLGCQGEVIVQTITTYINPLRKSYDSNSNLFVKGSF